MLVHLQTLARLAERFDGQSRVRHFGPRQQFACMVFAQLTWLEGLRGIEGCLKASPRRFTIWDFESLLQSPRWQMPTNSAIGACGRRWR